MNSAVNAIYDNGVLHEWQRLDTSVAHLEFCTTLHLIQKYFPKTGHVADIGGGPGRYTVELLKQGYQVTLVDLSEKAVAFAKTKCDELKLQPERIIQGDARDLSWLETDTFDAVLLMGPLYHVRQNQDRHHILEDLKRILKPDGVALVAYMNAWGVMRSSLTNHPDRFSNLDMAHSMLDTFEEGVWYYSTPPIALAEIRSVGLEILSYAGAEGFVGGGGMKPILAHLAESNPLAYDNVVHLAVETCELPQYRDTTDHLHIISQKSC